MGISKKIMAIAAASFLGALITFPVSAETISGKLEKANQDSITGWAWDRDDFDHILQVELHIFPSGSDKEAKIVTVKADHYREDLHNTIKDGYHGFEYSIDWSKLGTGDFTVKAYAVSEEGKQALEGTVSYNKKGNETPAPVVPVLTTGDSSGSDSSSNVGPAFGPAGKPVTGPGAPAQAVSGNTAKKGASLGIFTTSGYCNCEKCSGGHNLTYSGTVPQANHTISADLDVLPLNTKVMINDVIYTVEDIGSSVDGKRIDIFYASHEEALAHGVEEVEVFLVEES